MPFCVGKMREQQQWEKCEHVLCNQPLAAASFCFNASTEAEIVRPLCLSASFVHYNRGITFSNSMRKLSRVSSDNLPTSNIVTAWLFKFWDERKTEKKRD